jgi:hypothetical protein
MSYDKVPALKANKKGRGDRSEKPTRKGRYVYSSYSGASLVFALIFLF